MPVVGKWLLRNIIFFPEQRKHLQVKFSSSFIKSYYQSGREIPSTILVSSPVGEAELLEHWLADLKGSKVEIQVS